MVLDEDPPSDRLPTAEQLTALLSDRPQEFAQVEKNSPELRQLMLEAASLYQ